MLPRPLPMFAARQERGAGANERGHVRGQRSSSVALVSPRGLAVGPDQQRRALRDRSQNQRELSDRHRATAGE